MILTCMLYNALNTCARSVDISHKGCKYSIDLPSGWDTIPHDTLKKIFPRLDLDMGLYPVSQKEYFTGNYALVGFMPVLQSLHSYSFDRIVSDMKEMNDQTKNTWNNDSISTLLPELPDKQLSHNPERFHTIERMSVFICIEIRIHHTDALSKGK